MRLDEALSSNNSLNGQEKKKIIYKIYYLKKKFYCG